MPSSFPTPDASVVVLSARIDKAASMSEIVAEALLYSLLTSTLGLVVGMVTHMVRTLFCAVRGSCVAVETTVKGTLLMSPTVVMLTPTASPHQVDRERPLQGLCVGDSASSLVMPRDWPGFAARATQDVRRASRQVPVVMRRFWRTSMSRHLCVCVGRHQPQ